MFTIQQIQEIARRLSSISKRDSDFKPLNTWESLNGQDYIAFVKDGTNRTVNIDQICTYIRQNINSDIENALERITSLEIAVQELGTTLNTFIRNTNTHLTSLDNSIESINEVLSKLTTKCTITVTPVTPNATVFINGVRQNSMKVTSGSTVNVKVSAEGYDTYEEFILVEDNITLNPELSQSQVTLTINPTPTDANVELNGVSQKSITVDYNTSIHIKIFKDGYKTHEEDYTVTSTETKNITLTQIVETSWTDLVLSQADTSENPIGSVPKSGGKVSFKANVTAHFNDGSTEVKDVTSQVQWSVAGEGCTSNGGGVFTWTENTSTSTRSATVTANVTGPDSSSLSKTIQTTQQGSAETFKIEPSTLIFESDEGTQEVQISSNTSWRLE